MYKIIIMTILTASFLSGCATVAVESEDAIKQAKTFNTPPADKSGLYIFRNNSILGAALTKKIWVNNECVGKSARGTFFYHEVDANKEHTISTQSEFSPNDLKLYTKGGELYFVQQFIKFGAFVGGAGLKQVDATEGKAEIDKLKLAKKGDCSTE